MNDTMTTKRQRRQFSAEDRRRWIEQYEGSGQSVRDFCRDNALCQSSLSRWLRQRRAGTDERRQEGSLVELRVAPRPSAAAPPSVKVSLAGGVTMKVASGTDAAWLASVLRALQPVEG
jgi:transposase-like protein